MIKLSTGQDSTLGNYLKLCDAFFGHLSAQSEFIKDKIASSPNGPDEEVVAEESQMMYLLFNINEESTLNLEDIL